jgi:predicted DNA binding protein
MRAGIRVTIEFNSPDVCPIFELAASSKTTIQAVSRSVSVEGGPCVSEFSLDEDLNVDIDGTTVFSDGTTRRYRFEHDERPECPCEILGSCSIPVTRYVAREDRLTVVFHAVDYDTLQMTIAALRDRFPDIDIKRLIKSPVGESVTDGVYVDLDVLTNRQAEILQTAFDMGYFEQPRRTNATDIAATLDINPSTFREHLLIAESKIFRDLLQR